MHFQQERGVLAMSPGQALDDAFSALQIDRTQIYDLKCWVEQPASLDSFGFDAQYMYAVNSDRQLKDLWNSRPHGRS